MHRTKINELQLLENIINNAFDIAEGKQNTYKYEKVLFGDKKLKKLNDIIKHRVVSMIGKFEPVKNEGRFSEICGVSSSFNRFMNLSKTKFSKMEIAQNSYENNQQTELIHYEQNSINELYKEKETEPVSIDSLENDSVCETEDSTFLMNLKLSHSKDKLKSMLQNKVISNNLFFKLLKMYSWSGEDFFENSDNRDMSVAIITRFYTNIERKEHIEYSTQDFIYIILRCKEPSLLDAIAYLEPLQNSFKSNRKDQNYNIITAIATHNLTSPSVLNMFIKKADPYVKTLIAMRADCDASMQTILYEDGDEIVTEALSHNVNLDKKIVKLLVKNDLCAKNIAKYIILNDEIFDMLIKNYSSQLARNNSISFDMQKRIFEKNNEHTKMALASNKNIDDHSMANLLFNGSQDINFDIFVNKSTINKKVEKVHNKKRRVVSKW